MTAPRENTRVALFTSFHPDSGGGATNLRSVLPHLSNVTVTWFYLGDSPAETIEARCLGPRLMGGPMAVDMVRMPALWMGMASRACVRSWVDHIRSLAADVHWVVACNEGILLGNALRATCPQIPLHVSVQDDPAESTFGRSRRYRVFKAMVRGPFRRLMHGAASIDVTSDGMREYYRAQLGVRSVVVHPYVPKPVTVTRRPSGNGQTLTVGHLGAIYDAAHFARFLKGLNHWRATAGRQLKFVAIGMAAEHAALLPLSGADDVEVIAHLPEPVAIARLAEADFVYAMYPPGARQRVFRQTSLPTKLSTYAAAARPVFAHTPADSSLAALIREWQVGVVVESGAAAEIADTAESLRSATLGVERFEAMRQAVYGETNVARLAACLRGSAPAAR